MTRMLSLKKEIKEDTQKMDISPIALSRQINIAKMALLPKAIHKCTLLIKKSCISYLQTCKYMDGFHFSSKKLQNWPKYREKKNDHGVCSLKSWLYITTLTIKSQETLLKKEIKYENVCPRKDRKASPILLQQHGCLNDV